MLVEKDLSLSHWNENNRRVKNVKS